MSGTRYQLRHAGSPKAQSGLTLERIVEALRDGRCDATDEVRADGAAAWQALEAHPHFAELVEELEEAVGPRREEPTQLDMTALIDVCLVLLIFFILTTTYATAIQKVVPIPPVQSDNKKAREVTVDEVRRKMIRLTVYKDASDQFVVRVDNTSRDVLTGGDIDKGKLADELRREVKGDVLRTEVLLDTWGITWGTFVAIQDAARNAGVDKIHHLKAKKTP